MAAPRRTATTPIGTFTRRTDNLYQFIGVWRWQSYPSRWVRPPDGGDYVLETYGDLQDHEVVKWSRTAKGASTNSYVPETARFFGPYPVDPKGA